MLRPSLVVILIIAYVYGQDDLYNDSDTGLRDFLDMEPAVMALPDIISGPVDKRHIFYTGGWGAGGSTMGYPRGKDIKVQAARKSSDQPVPGVSGAGQPSASKSGRVRQLFLSRNWGPG
ncbi:uncharacterized protein LOC129592705 isoform X2 [Paramacrobiotus metropolitanus]|nr:uncharacterized protein LOC129592705 isoform X2 [Paramacrobiotus metropolitanus]XP_055344784.1 uncharacterized protein LOC129592705 isoform X2 [Paramacrobiotus metropolitanus]